MDTAVFLGTAENFVYGLCSAYFIYESATYFRHRREQRFYRTAAAIMAFWFLLVLAAWIYSCYVESSISNIAYIVIVTVVWAAVNHHYRKVGRSIDEVRQIMSEKQPALEGMPDFSAEVEALFVEKKLHRNHDLSVSQLAREIGTNRSYLSAWLNNTLGTNFYDFVNGYRIADAEAMLAGGDCSMTQDEIATTVGFNSLSTFRRAFIKKHGITPRQYCRDKRHKK